MALVVMYGTLWCPDCYRARRWLQRAGVKFVEINIDWDTHGEAVVLRVNGGRRTTPTFQIGERFLTVSPFNPEVLEEALRAASVLPAPAPAGLQSGDSAVGP
ncbi:Putative glutaredoxin.1 [bacterium HR11]|nr:Putative glutaredoxin.1 [bacterium HR11]